MAARNRLPVRLRTGQQGLVLIALLFMLTLVAVGALSAAEVWSTTRKHEREQQLLWVGDQYRKAVESYWKKTPGARKVLPSTIDQLLNDDRFPNPVHHLRQAYTDPMTDGQDFEIIKINNALVGVHSTSTDAPMKIANFPRRYSTFADATDYTQWQFVFTPPSPRAAGLAPGQVPGQNGLAPAPVSPGLPALGAPTVGLGRGH